MMIFLQNKCCISTELERYIFAPDMDNAQHKKILDQQVEIDKLNQENNEKHREILKLIDLNLNLKQEIVHHVDTKSSLENKIKVHGKKLENYDEEKTKLKKKLVSFKVLFAITFVLLLLSMLLSRFYCKMKPKKERTFQNFLSHFKDASHQFKNKIYPTEKKSKTKRISSIFNIGTFTDTSGIESSSESSDEPKEIELVITDDCSESESSEESTLPVENSDMEPIYEINEFGNVVERPVKKPISCVNVFIGNRSATRTNPISSVGSDSIKSKYNQSYATTYATSINDKRFEQRKQKKTSQNSKK